MAGLVGLDPGRYLNRAGGERVLVVGVEGAPPPPRRRFRRAKPKDADPEAPQSTVPLTTLTAIRTEPLGDDAAAERWLGAVRADPEAIEAELSSALELINRAVHAHRTAAMDPHLPDASAEHALAVRLGYGAGSELAEGRYSEAIELALGERQRLREALRPQERVAAVLGGRESVPACEALILRARGDLDAGRTREAALALDPAVHSLLAELPGATPPAVAEDLESLRARLGVIGHCGAEAMASGLSDELASEVAETLRRCERILRRRRLA